MQKKILIALDDSVHARFALKYALAAADLIADLHYVLVQAHPKTSAILAEEAKVDSKVRRELEQIARLQRVAAEAVLGAGRDMLVECGIDPARIETVSLDFGQGIAQDLIAYAHNKRVDAIVAGRRGISGLQAYFMGSVSNNLVQQSMEIPVWVVGDKAVPKKILLAVDGRANALRALDHAAFMLGPPDGAHLTLLHMRPRLRDYCEIDINIDMEAGSDASEVDAPPIDLDAPGCVEDFYPKVQAKLTEFGFDPNQVAFETVDAFTSIGRGIVKAAREGDFDTIVLGRSGDASRGFTGRVSHHVLNSLTDRAIWLVP